MLKRFQTKIFASLGFMTVIILLNDGRKWSHVTLKVSRDIGILDKKDKLFPLDSDNTFKRSSCTPKTNIFYLKVHKTGSSTLTAWLYRLAWRRNLTIVPVPMTAHPQKDYLPHVFHRPGDDDLGTYNVLGEHVTFNETSIKMLMPPDTVYIASLRHPFDQFKSYFNQFFHDPQYQSQSGSDPFLDFVNGPMRSTLRLKHRNLWNFMSGIFGFEKAKSDNATAVKNFLHNIKSKFSFITFAEYFDESMLLLQQLLCLDMKDMIYLVLRKKEYQHKKKVYAPSVQETHKRWSAVDYTLYRYFVQELFNELSKQDGLFWEKLHQYKDMNQVVSQYCADIESQLRENSTRIFDFASTREKITINPEPWDDPFDLFAVDCAVMNLKTKALGNVLLVRQTPIICDKNVKREPEQLLNGIKWQSRNVVSVHPFYCSDWDEYFKIPLKVLSLPHVYMWLLQ